MSLDNFIGNIEKDVSTRNPLNNFCEVMAFISQVQPNNFTKALQDEN